MERKTISFRSPGTREKITLYVDKITGYGYDDFNKLHVFAVGGARFNVDENTYRSLAGNDLPPFLEGNNENEVSE